MAGGPCLHPLAAVSVPRIMSERESHLLVVQVASDDGTRCTAAVEVATAGFEISPPETKRSLDLTSDQPEGTLRWLLAPRRAGDYSILVTSGLDSSTTGVVVTTVLGFSARTAQVLTYLSYALGSVLTVPWWVEILRKRFNKSGGA